jgi:hypothetical protein
MERSTMSATRPGLLGRTNIVPRSLRAGQHKPANDQEASFYLNNLLPDY